MIEVPVFAPVLEELGFRSWLTGLIHLGNCTPIQHLLVLHPQTIGGLLFAYTRTQVGPGAAMVPHACYKGATVALVLVVL